MNVKTGNIVTNLRQRPLIFLDIESTGLEIQKHEIIEIGALKVDQKKPFKILEEFNIKVKPTNLEVADKEALKIVGFTPEDWKDAVSLKEALEALDKFADGGVLAGYNVSFDWGILDRAYYLQGRTDPFYYHRLDVMPMAYLKLFSKKSLTRFSLGEICRHFKIERKVAHQALADAKVTYLVFKKLMK